MLNTYPNLPELQRSTQLLADRFNADERFWEKLKKKRNLRRKIALLAHGGRTLSARPTGVLPHKNAG